MRATEWGSAGSTVRRSDGPTVGGTATNLRSATVPSFRRAPVPTVPLLARALLVLLGAGAAAAAIQTFRPEPADDVRWATGQAAIETPLAGPTLSPADLIVLARRTTPFRLGRKPSSERYGAPPVSVAPLPPPAPKPQLVLSGILWGREPAAIVEGVPGQEAPVVFRQGESIGPFRLIRIEAGKAVIQGMDTTWTLTVREPWK